MSPAEFNPVLVIKFLKKVIIVFFHLPSCKGLHLSTKNVHPTSSVPIILRSVNVIVFHLSSRVYSSSLQTNIIFDPVAGTHPLFQITSVDAPGCKSAVRQENFPLCFGANESTGASVPGCGRRLPWVYWAMPQHRSANRTRSKNTAAPEPK